MAILKKGQILIGTVYIWCSLIANLWVIFALSIGIKRGNRKMIRAGRAGISIASIFCTMAIGVLLVALIVNDFSFRYVAEVSNLSQPIIYRIAALWGGISGSLLFQLWLLTVFSAMLILTKRTNRPEHLANHTLLSLAVIQLFFNIIVTGVVSGVYSPFSRIKGVVVGQGMNPLLQTPSMIFHLLALYVGLIGFSVPFAFAIATLTSGKIQSGRKGAWYIQTRRVTMFAWLALTLGIALRGVWTYSELGWGGYWAWNAIENVSLITWLLATAFLHTAIVQERQNRLVSTFSSQYRSFGFSQDRFSDEKKCWNFISIALVFESTLFSTFITRSGIIASVHAFDQSAIDYYFLGFIILSSMSVFALIIYRWKRIRSIGNRSNVKIMSRTGVFTITNWLFLAMAFVIFLGTIFPIASKIVTGHEIRVSEKYFNQITRPLGLGLLLMMSVGIALSQKQAKQLALRFSVSVLAAMAIFILGLIKGMRLFELKNVYLLICAFVFVFVAISIGLELHKSAKKRSEVTGKDRFSALITSIRRNRRRYGGYISHIGIAIIAISILGSKGYQKSLVEGLKQGEIITIDKYSLRFDQIFEQDKPNMELVGVEITIMSSGKEIGKLYPAMAFYKQTAHSSPTKEVAIRRGLLADLYVAFSGITEDQAVVLNVHYTPLVNLLWFGCILVLAGGIMAAAKKIRVRLELSQKV